MTGPEDIRTRFARYATADLVAGLASLRPRPGSMVRYHTLLSLRELGRRAQFLDGQLERLDELIVALVTARAPGLLSLYGVGPDTAAKLLIAAGDHPERPRSEAARAHLRAAAPIPASSGKVNRHRLNPHGDRQAGHALLLAAGLSEHLGMINGNVVRAPVACTVSVPVGVDRGYADAISKQARQLVIVTQRDRLFGSLVIKPEPNAESGVG